VNIELRKRIRCGLVLSAVLSLTVQGVTGQAPGATSETTIAIVGATVIDGHGGPPLADATIVVRDTQIAAVGPRSTTTVPAGARIIDGRGKFATPGFIDTNVHVSPLSGQTSFARYWDRLEDVILQASQLHLKYGVTTIRDSYGPLPPLIAVRDAIARGREIGPRMYVAGNIVGWGGPYSETFSRTREAGLTLFEEQMNDLFTQGTGEELLHMSPEELRIAINKYLDKGPDFIKYGGTAHYEYPALIAFSPRTQEVIVEETHKRGLIAETHSATPEGLRISILAGIDLIQHPRSLGGRELTDELVKLIVDRKIICSGLSNTTTGKPWKDHLKKREQVLREREEQAKESSRSAPKTTAEIRREQEELGHTLEVKRRNEERLIKAGCIVSVGTDNTTSMAPEFRRTEKSEHQEPGIGTILGIEGLVELGMTPSQAIVAATKNGASACRALDKFGTLEPGKIADVLLLGADPLANIANIRKLELVMKEGRVIDISALPVKRPYGEWSSTSEPH
jgi:imidazolonepropionase-like amidohydrolase